MPFYDYECENCGRFEVKRSILSEVLTECPKCKGNVHLIFYPAKVIWKGAFRFMKGEPEMDMEKIEAEQRGA